jgi:hypothetical protein
MSVVQDSTAISNELDYKILQSSHPTYRLSKILPLSGSQSVTVTPSGGQETLFEIPTKAFNLSESSLYFNIATPAAANTRFNFMFEDTLAPIQQIQLYTRSGKYLCDLNHVANYMRVVSKRETSFNEYESNDAVNRLYKSNALATASLRFDDSGSNVSYIEPRYLQVSAQEGGASESVITQLIQFKLSALRNTIFAINKDLMFPEVLVMRIVWQAGNRISFYANAATTPQTGTTASAGNHSVTSLALYLAVEKNDDIAQGLASKISSGGGMKVLIPYVHSYKNNLASTSQSIALRFNRGHGRTLKKIYHAPFNGTETTSTAYDNDNINGAKVTSLVSYMDQNRLQEINPTSSTAVGEDYLFQKNSLDGSVILNQNVYMHNWSWLDDFTQGKAPAKEKNVADSNIISGLSLDQEHLWSIALTTANATYNHYTFAVVSKIVDILPSQIEIM